MTAETIRELRDAAPFKKFDIHLTNGHTLPVVSSDHLFLIPDSSEFMVVLPDGGFRIVDVNQVMSLGRGAGTKKKP
jgi:hypothetical protein